MDQQLSVGGFNDLSKLDEATLKRINMEYKKLEA